MHDLHRRASDRLGGLMGAPRFSWLHEVSAALPALRWFVVGGAVRDAMRGRGNRADVDLIARGVPYADLKEALERCGRVDLVGRVFGVIKFRPEGVDEEFDIALPRTERAGMSGGYRDFAVQADPMLPIEADLARRDFTVNAMAWDVARAVVVDPFRGAEDLDAKLLRAVGDPSERFAEDVSRALRGLRFSCELDFEIEGATMRALRKTIRRVNELDAKGERLVPMETVAKELVKMFRIAPSWAAAQCKELGVFAALIPELDALADCPQPPEYHAEGDVWRHTQLALEAFDSPGFVKTFDGERPDAETIFAVLFHDVAKPQTMALREGRLTYYGHPDEGAHITRAVAERLMLSSYQGIVSVDRLVELVRLHLFPVTVDLTTVRRTTLAKYFLKDRRFGRQLLMVAYVDAAASLRDDGTVDLAHIDALLTVVADLEKTAGPDPMKALLTGDEIMSQTHLSPGPDIGALLDDLRESQLRGEVTTHAEAMDFIKKRTQP